MNQWLPLKNGFDVERRFRDFEPLKLPYGKWTHRAHLAVAIHYLRNPRF
jgi:hypothetical protein